MTLDHLIEAIVYGAVEGLTEFLPVSSTGHLLLLGHFLGAGDGEAWKTFVILIQLGAILAIMAVYATRLTHLVLSLPKDPGSRRFVFGILIAFLPAVAAGVVLYPIIKTVFFETPTLVCISLVIGGFVLLIVDALTRDPRYTDAERYPLPMYLAIGIAQCIAMIPGVSRSGATIASAVLMGSSKRAAAEFSFFLAMPTMAAAFSYDLLKSYKTLVLDDVAFIAVGFAAAFVAGVIVVKLFLEIVSRYGFAPFAWYRIVAGVLGLVAIYTLPAPHPAAAMLERPAIVVTAGG
jgi:undecaprenyl-diphosphatase